MWQRIRLYLLRVLKVSNFQIVRSKTVISYTYTFQQTVKAACRILLLNFHPYSSAGFVSAGLSNASSLSNLANRPPSRLSLPGSTSSQYINDVKPSTHLLSDEGGRKALAGKTQEKTARPQSQLTYSKSVREILVLQLIYPKFYL